MALQGASVPVSDTATIKQIRRLYAELPGNSSVDLGETETEDEREIGETNEQNANATITSAATTTPAATFSTSNSAVRGNGNPAVSASMQQMDELEASLEGLILVNRNEWRQMRENVRILLQQQQQRQQVEQNEVGQLRAEIERLRQPPQPQPLQQPVQQAAPVVNKLNEVGAIDSVIEKFTADDHGDVNKWFDKLEHALVMLGFDERLRLVACRRMLGGTAEAFARANPVFVYADLKAKLVAEFGRNRTVPEVYAMLAARRLRTGENIRRYVLDMQEIAAQAAIPEIELVDNIIAGLGDTSSNVSMLYSVQCQVTGGASVAA